MAQLDHPVRAAPTGAHPARRPFALYALSFLLLVKAGVLLAVALDVRLAEGSLLRRFLRASTDLGRLVDSALLADLLTVVLAMLLIGSALGLILLRRDGWLLAMVLTGLFVAVDVAGFIAGDVVYIWMALNIATVFYLNQADLRGAVGVSTESVVPDLPA